MSISSVCRLQKRSLPELRNLLIFSVKIEMAFLKTWTILSFQGNDSLVNRSKGGTVG